jgi:zinc transport system substrate-binding protein
MMMPDRFGSSVRRRFGAVIATAVLALGLVACGGDDGASGSSPSGEPAVSVVASFYPLAFAAEQVGGDLVEVTNLTPPGVEPHDLELTPDDIEAIAAADVVLYLGGGFQPAVEEAIDAEATGITVDASEGVELLPPPPEDAHADEEEHADEELAADPHIWLDPTLFAGVVDRTAAALEEAVPSEATAIQDRAAELDTELGGLDGEFAEGLATCGTRILITNHAAFAYLAAAYDLEQEAISGLSPESEPDPERLAELAEEAEADGVSTVFTEELVSPEVAETLAAEAGLETAVLSPLEGLTEDMVAAGDDYFSVMRRNLETLREGLDCT